MVNEGINLAGIKRIIELESAMSNMAIEVAKLRIEVDSLLMENRVEKINNKPLFNALPGREVKQITRINTEE
jgi:regulator of replication initiation timing